MRQVLKIAIKAHAHEAVMLREAERRSLHIARNAKEVFEREDQKHKEDKETSDFHYLRYWNLHQRRTHNLRKEQRDQFVAYAFVRGVPYKNIEDVENNKSAPDWKHVEELSMLIVGKTPDNIQRWEQWYQEARGIQDQPQKTA